jgi:hypothetical protein
MRNETELKPDGMQRISLMFCNEEPDPEDLWIRDQLEKFPIPPKRVLEWERDGRKWQVLQYGQCVIGHALFDIEKHKRVVDRIQTTSAQELTGFNGDRARVLEAISQVALEFHKEARFTVDGTGELAIDVNEEKLRQRVVQCLANEE